MTAILGVLNKEAIAIAADSAVTIQNGSEKKIFNKANKIFALSMHHPVGIMIYNSAEFMGTPWETIIKVYRKQLKDTAFDTLDQYKEDFLQFLRRKQFFTDAQQQQAWVIQFCDELYDSLVQQVTLHQWPPAQAHLPEDHHTQLLHQIEVEAESYRSANNPCKEFEDYGLDSFLAEFGPHILPDRWGMENWDDPQMAMVATKFKELAHLVLCAQDTFGQFTGLVFCGFGEEEIFPQLIPVNASCAISGRLRYFEDHARKATITVANPAAICPFAQTDVILTILTGIDPGIRDMYAAFFQSVFGQYNQTIKNELGPGQALLHERLSKLDEEGTVSKLNEAIEQYVLEQHIYPLRHAVASLSKEDLAEMAESLIYLTYLKRRISNAEESVGGPVDVAIISKGDGLVWIKRKHYFDPKLNPQHMVA